MTQRMTDKKRFKKSLRLIQAMMRDNFHGAGDPTTVNFRRLEELDRTLDGIRVPGEEPEEEQPDAIDGE
jgi:Txe/YoeB family toxin of Txe-Axe toxin-antitoxin module